MTSDRPSKTAVRPSCQRRGVDQSLIRSEPLALTLSAGAAPSTESEVLRELTEHAVRRRADEMAPGLAARALRVSRGAEFAVARDALDALLRRLGSSRDDELIVRSAAHGLRVARRGRGTRSPRAYDVWLDDVGESSCSCPDFAKASLGMCKHVFAALAKSRSLGRQRSALRAVRWDPVRPLTRAGRLAFAAVARPADRAAALVDGDISGRPCSAADRPGADRRITARRDRGDPSLGLPSRPGPRRAGGLAAARARARGARPAMADPRSRD